MNIPANVKLVFDFLIDIANFNWIDTKAIYSKVFPFLFNDKDGDDNEQVVNVML